MTGEDLRNTPLFSGILAEAQAKAEAIRMQAEDEAVTILTSAREKAEEAASQEATQLTFRLEELKRRVDSTKRNIERKLALQQMDCLEQEVLAKVREKLSTMVGTEHYQNMVVGWIAEAAIGLDRKEAIVNCSAAEKVSDEMLRQAEKLVMKSTGGKVHLTYDSTPLQGQGIVVSTPDGLVSYNNQVETRIHRYERSIRTILEQHHE